MGYIDQLGRQVRLTKQPKRIISLVPSQTELLFDLGLFAKIVGVTKFCVHPEGIRKEKQVVGGTKNVHFDKIRALKPDIVLCNKEENTKEMVEALQKEFPVHVSDITTTEDSLELIRQYGEIFEVADKAKRLGSEIKSELNNFLDFIADKPTKKVAYFIWRKPWMVAGKGTFINHLLSLNRFANVYSHKERYPEISENELQNVRDLDLILLSSEPFPFSENHLNEIKKFKPDSKVILVDGEYFSWHGSRLSKAFNYFKTLH